MAIIKRTTPGPSISNVGSSKGAPKNVGMKGNTSGLTSTGGGQHSFMPAGKTNTGKGGQVSSSSDNKRYDFLPKKTK